MNTRGNSSLSTSNPMAPAGPPFPPVDVVAVFGDMQAFLTWNASWNNGANVTAFYIYSYPDGIVTKVVGSPPFINGTNVTGTLTNASLSNNTVIGPPPLSGTVVGLRNAQVLYFTFTLLLYEVFFLWAALYFHHCR